MPANPPRVLNRIDQKEKMSLPQRPGMRLPIVEPTKSPNQMNVFLPME